VNIIMPPTTHSDPHPPAHCPRCNAALSNRSYIGGGIFL
jgi:hypothetical protein